MKRRSSSLRLCLGVAVAAIAAATLLGSTGVSTADSSGGSYAPGELLVRFAADADASAAHAALGAEVVKTFEIVPNLQHVRLPTGVDVEAAVAAYEARPEVLYAQPNFYYYINAAPNDPLYPSMYNHDNTGQTGGTIDADVDSPEAWDITPGSVKIAVGDVDTGIDYNHPDLAAHAMPNKRECSGLAGIDDEGNGYVDDCHGIDTINGDSDPMDGNQHGTHTAGIIGAVGNNGIGVTGVNQRVTIVACKSHDDAVGVGTAASIIECFQYMETMKRLGVNVVATNNSYGGCSEACGFDQATHDAIKSNMTKGILFAASAGNDQGVDNDVVEKYPVGYYLPNVIGVASTTHTDARSSFSNVGDRTVHVGAPGSSVRSTVPGGAYALLSGTSMSAPHVAGLAALLKSSNFRLKWWQIRNLILAGGDPKPSMATTTITGRRINSYGSLTCSNVPVVAHLRPLPTVAGSPIRVAVHDINCASAAATAPTVTITPGGTVLQLRDNGAGADIARKDGTFSAYWTPNPCTPGTYTFTYSNGEIATSNITC